MQERERGRDERYEGQNDRHYRRSNGDDAMRRERERERYEGSRYESGAEWEPAEWERQRPSWQRPAEIYGQRRDQEFGTQHGPARYYGEAGQAGEWGPGRGRSSPWREAERAPSGSYSTGQGAYGEGPSSYGQWQGGYAQRGPQASDYGRPAESGRFEGWRAPQGGYGAGAGEYGQRWRGFEPERGWQPGAWGQGAGMFGGQQPAERFGERYEGPHAGRGPKGYTRSKERILDDVNQALQDDSWLDASEIDVQCEAGEVVLRGTVNSRHDKRRAEECAERIAGVKDVRNEIRVRSEQESTAARAGGKSQSGSGRTTSANPT
ncbi:MAG TPA: BON domain-containing protein [Myxococcota bacterium]|nr:BON domain-containing protein [Myxococcota bacterium]